MGLPIKYEHIFLLSLSNARSNVKFYGQYALLYQNISLRYSNSFCLLEFRPKQFCFLGSQHLLLRYVKPAGVNLGALPLQCKTRSLIQALNMDTSAQ